MSKTFTFNVFLQQGEERVDKNQINFNLLLRII